MKLQKVNCLKRSNCVTKTRDLLQLLLVLFLFIIIIIMIFFNSSTAAVTGLMLMNVLFISNDASHSL